MKDYFVEFKQIKKINASPILLEYEEWDHFTEECERDEFVIQGNLVEMYRCSDSGLCALLTGGLVLFYDDSETMFFHLMHHLNLQKIVNIFEIN